MLGSKPEPEQQAQPRVYVDELPAGWGKWSGGAHMLANDLDALHAMANRLGLKRAWFQGDKTFAHYDLTASKRKLAVVAGAIEIGLAEIPDDVLMLRREDGTYERRCDRIARRAEAQPCPCGSGLPIAECDGEREGATHEF